MTYHEDQLDQDYYQHQYEQDFRRDDRAAEPVEIDTKIVLRQARRRADDAWQRHADLMDAFLSDTNAENHEAHLRRIARAEQAAQVAEEAAKAACDQMWVEFFTKAQS